MITRIAQLIDQKLNHNNETIISLKLKETINKSL